MRLVHIVYNRVHYAISYIHIIATTNHYIEQGMQGHHVRLYRHRIWFCAVYYWPEIEKYPWHSHQKRFPKPEDISISLFSEFVNRNIKIRTLFETLHPLPYNGVNCLVWKEQRFEGSDKREDYSQSQLNVNYININGSYYRILKGAKNDMYYLIKGINYRVCHCCIKSWNHTVETV